ncbi:MAG: NAD(P)H-dependent oxidoreductase [Pseudobdellovibrionaceae bacterium]|uniref:NAD(P)H-dependent oxidoreductase n=1 Tax=Oligoflexus sp. TaxID=1971216 RepID=UPI0027C6CAA1|nr:NAD(P)H-dependent oxidoreductase [Oligoflexus sp.]MDQ3232183.1 NAD(P)H-dependent oxidoreductase [Pseudobdellovibrionaceae bacterium]HYX34317.1 NAD(P)H-dependent oxidoreductase [Oligoflexus sp.]
MTSKRNILILYAHPNPIQSYVQKVLRQAIQDLEGVEIRDLYRQYPHFYIDVGLEQEALLRADLIIFQHPLYWYSCPALLKEWQDTVLQPGFAYGPGGTSLRGKDFLQVLSLGALESTYHRQGGNRFSLPEFLRPFEATAYLCGLNYHWPFFVQGGTRLAEAFVQDQGHRYRQLLEDYLQNGSAALVPLNTAAEGFSHD